MYTKSKYVLCLLALLFCCYSCSNDNMAIGESDANAPHVKILLNASDNIRDYSDIYVFEGKESKLDYYHHKVLNVERTPGYLKMNMPEGLWNTVIVACSEADIRSQLIAPAFTATKANMPMWITKPVGGVLPDLPQIRTALIDQTLITADEIQNVSATLNRNVAKIRVVLKDGVGFKAGTANSFYLKNVPTSLAWDGSLYPSKENPTVTNVPMTKSVRLFASTLAGHQQSDTIDFVIPAHKSKTATDFSTHKIVLGMKFTTLGSSTFAKEAVVHTAPKDNQILLLNVTAKGGVEIEIDVQEWQTVSWTEAPKTYTMEQISTTTKVVTYAMQMHQERNWWVTLDDTSNFEFVDGSVTFGQKTAAAVNIQVRRRTSGGALSTKLNLYMAGLDGLVEKYNVTDLVP